jgi:predicted RNA binding protein YcfA (HicA-like mRNA interferase family)
MKPPSPFSPSVRRSYPQVAAGSNAPHGDSRGRPPRGATALPRDVLAILRSFGFEVDATRGSHAKLRRVAEDRQTLTLPLHRDLDLGTVRAICRQAARFIPEAELRPRFYDD